MSRKRRNKLRRATEAEVADLYYLLGGFMGQARGIAAERGPWSLSLELSVLQVKHLFPRVYQGLQGRPRQAGTTGWSHPRWDVPRRRLVEEALLRQGRPLADLTTPWSAPVVARTADRAADPAVAPR